MAPIMKISIVIATHNRKKSVKRLLTSLCDVVWPSQVDFEVIVVTSACTDGTDAVVAPFAHVMPLTVVELVAPGLSRARNRALEKCSGAFVLFLDDDVTVDPGLARAYAQSFARHPETSFFGGAINIRFEGNPPNVIRQVSAYLPSTYSGLWLGENEQNFDPNMFQTPFGANMAIRRDALKEVRFDEALGRNAASGPQGGEEVKLFRELAQLGHTGLWVPAAKVDHWIDAERQTMRYVRDYWQQAGALQIKFGRRDDTNARLNPAKRLRLLLRLAGYRVINRPACWLPAFRELEQERGRICEIRKPQ
jgi:glycosyltransferase involved in cell wall biosynthesis